MGLEIIIQALSPSFAVVGARAAMLAPSSSFLLSASVAASTRVSTNFAPGS